VVKLLFFEKKTIFWKNQQKIAVVKWFLLEFFIPTQYKHVKVIIKLQNLVLPKQFKQKRSKWCKPIHKKQNKGNKFQFLYVKRQKKEKIRITQKKSYDSTMLRCSKNLDYIFLSISENTNKKNQKTRWQITLNIH
jgi:hypothetical protein